MLKFYYQTVSVNRNSKQLKNAIVEFLKKDWLWDESDFKDGLKETRYSLSFELMNDDQSELKHDVTDLIAKINSIKKNGKVYCSSIKTK